MLGCSQLVHYLEKSHTNSSAMKKTLFVAAKDGWTSKILSAAADQHGKSIEWFFHY